MLDEHSAWVKKHQEESKKALKKLNADTLEAKRKQDELYWQAESKKTYRGQKPINEATYVAGVGAKKESIPYTGDKMIGIAAMHKSNTVPIFNTEAAKDVAKMRR